MGGEPGRRRGLKESGQHLESSSGWRESSGGRGMSSTVVGGCLKVGRCQTLLGVFLLGAAGAARTFGVEEETIT